MRERCIQSTKKFLHWTARECSVDVKESILKCKAMVISVDEPKSSLEQALTVRAGIVEDGGIRTPEDEEWSD